MVNSFPVGPPLPSLSYLCEYLYRHIATHPLIVKPVVFHPITGDRIYIDKYRLYNGIEITESGLTCSIFPHSTPTDGLSLPKPQDTSVSVLFDNEEYLGNQVERAIYHVGLKLHLMESMLNIEHPSQAMRTIPIDAVIDPSQNLLTNMGNKEVSLEINPSSYVLSNYLELIRIALLDKQHTVELPYSPSNIQVLYFNLKEGPWEKSRKLLFHEAEMLIRIDSVLGRGWRDRFNTPIESINVDLS